MKKTLTIAVLGALFSFSASTFAQGEEGMTQLYTVKEAVQSEQVQGQRPSSKSDQGTVVPVDLDAASRQTDVALPEQPVRIQSDRLLSRNSDGYIIGRGNVDVQQGMEEIHTNQIEGNTKSQVYHTKGPSVYLTSTMALEGDTMTYQAGKQSATLDEVSGFIDSAHYVRGTGAQMYDGMLYLKHGLITTPHAVAKTPDYYLTGDDIRIYPGEKFIAENTKLWFKHVCILTYGHYEGRLDKTEQRPWIFTLLPRQTYNNDNGIGLHGDGQLALSQDGNTYLDVDYYIYSKDGFKPSLRIGHRTPYGTFSFGYSKEESTDNDNHIWATKWPELRYYAPRIRFGKTGIYADGSASWGRWSEDGKDGSHKGYRVELSHNPIALWNKANLRFFGGYRRDLYGYSDSERRDPYWGAILNQGINDRLWTSWWYKKHNISGRTPYRFDTIDNPRQKGFSIGYVLTPLDTVVFSLNKNLDSGDIEDRNFTWIRDLHSFVAILTYEQVDKEWTVQVIAKDLDF